MSALVVAGHAYSCVRGSDVSRDGMYLELSEMEGKVRHIVMEIFYSDKTGDMTVQTFRDGVPLSAAEWMIAQAKELLPPVLNPETDAEQ